MSRLDDIKEQLKSQWQILSQKIQDSQAYIQLQDRYQTMTPSMQKMTKFGIGFLIVFLFLFYPFSLFFTSQESISLFEEKRNLIRELFKTYRETSARPNISMPPAVESLKASIASIIQMQDLTPEQNQGVTDSFSEGSLIPQSLVSNVLEVHLSKLNIKQIVDIGTGIIGISDTVKMKDMSLSAHPADTRYFDVKFKLYTLKVPEATPEPPPEMEAKPKKGSKSNSDSGSNKDSNKGDDL